LVKNSKGAGSVVMTGPALFWLCGNKPLQGYGMVWWPGVTPGLKPRPIAVMPLQGIFPASGYSGRSAPPRCRALQGLVPEEALAGLLNRIMCLFTGAEAPAYCRDALAGHLFPLWAVSAAPSGRGVAPCRGALKIGRGFNPGLRSQPLRNAALPGLNSWPSPCRAIWCGGLA